MKPTPNHEGVPSVFTFPLIDLVAEATKLAPRLARKAIRRGEVRVDGVVVKDPGLRVHGDSVVKIGYDW